MKTLYIPLTFLILLIFSIASMGAESGIPEGSQIGAPRLRKTPSSSVPESGINIRSESYSYGHGGISIYLSSFGGRIYPPCSLLVENPEGLRTGHDPINGLYYNEIPNSVYKELVKAPILNDPTPFDQMPRTLLLDISIPSDGDYILYVTGSDKGRYLLKFSIYEFKMDSSSKRFNDISITPDETHIYYFNYLYNTKDGTEIYFIGSDKHSKSMNKIIEYINPSKKVSHLPANTDNYNFTLLYGEAIIASTFKAKVNGRDITHLFNPVRGEKEEVRLELNQSRNKVVISVDAIVDNKTINHIDTFFIIVNKQAPEGQPLIDRSREKASPQ